MVSELLLNATSGVAVFYGLSPTYAVYFFALFFSVFMGIVLGVKSGRPYMGLIGFMGTLMFFALIDGFPLWILGMGAVIVIVVGGFLHGKGD